MPLKESQKLRECPFCDKTDKVRFYTESMVHHGELLWILYGVKCKRCNFGIPTYAKKATAIRKWNTRPAEDAKGKEIERLKAALEKIYHISFGNAPDKVKIEFIKTVVYGAVHKNANAPDTNVGKMEEK